MFKSLKQSVCYTHSYQTHMPVDQQHKSFARIRFSGYYQKNRSANKARGFTNRASAKETMDACL